MTAYGSKQWKAEKRKEKLAAAAKEREKKAKIKAACEAVGKVLDFFPLSEYTKGLNRERATVIRKARDFLAGASL
jgi:outer membrane protein assembly factor BamD (BamD/ComL family)